MKTEVQQTWDHIPCRRRRGRLPLCLCASVVNLFLALLLVLGWLGMAPVQTPAAPGQEKNPSAPAQTAAPAVIKSESSVVLVDVIVTDKKGRYLKDVSQNEFHVFEDGAEQSITSFSREADMQPGATEHPRYMVLFFDNTGLDSAGQMWERDAAAKFVEGVDSPQGAQGIPRLPTSSAGAQGLVPLQPTMMAVLDYDRGLRVAQNFTADADRLMSAVRNTQFAPPQTILPSLSGQGEKPGSDPPTGSLLQALRDVARMLGAAPGRKTLLYFSAGFGLTSRRPTDFQDTVDALNKANVGVYTFSAGGSKATTLGNMGNSQGYRPRFPGDPGQTLAQQASAMDPNASSGGAISDLAKLATQTGGFPIANTNDLAGGLQKVSGKMNEYYLLGYAPPSPVHDGRYHKIQVKVDRAGAEVRARSGYADSKSPDLLAGKTEGVTLEAKATNSEAGTIPVNLRTPYFYVRLGVARVNLALSIPGSAVNFDQHQDDLHAQINVLGIAYRDDGSVATRFSDTVNLNYEKDKLPEVRKTSIDYQNFILIAPGEYTFKLVRSAGGAEFGKYIKPLIVDPFTGKQLTLSGPAFGDRAIPSLLGTSDIDQKDIGGSVPLVANGVQLVPSSSNHFASGAQPVVYVEVYDPLQESSSPQMGILFNILNAKNHQQVYSSNTLPISEFAHQGNPLVPVIFKLPIDKLPPADYALEIWARDSAQNVSPVQTGYFSIE